MAIDFLKAAQLTGAELSRVASSDGTAQNKGEAIPCVVI
jgi:hypothetical protein